MAPLLRWLALTATERPIRALFIASLLTLVAGWFAGGLEVSTARTALVSEDDPHWQRYRAFSKEFGIPEDLVIVIKGDDPVAVREASEAAAADVAAQTEQIGSVFHRIDLAAFKARGALYLGYSQVQLMQRLASEPAVAHLRQADDAPHRLAALNELMRRAPSIWSEPSTPTDFHAMSAVLRGLLVQMSRFALMPEDSGTPTITLAGPETLAAAVGNPLAGSGLDSAGYLTADGGRTAVLFVRPLYHADDIKVVRPFVETVRATCERTLADHGAVTFGLTGIPASQVDEQDAIQRDSRVTSLVALCGVIVLFLLYFASVRLLLLSLLPVLVGVVCTAAMARLIHGHVNLISSIFLVILIGMGIDFSIHISSRFLEWRQSGLLPVAAAQRAVEQAGRGLLTGGVTSAGAFGALSFTKFKGMAELGEIACLGLIVTLLAALTVLPATLVLAGPSEARTRQGFWGMNALVDLLVRFRVPALALVIITIAPAAWLTTQTEFDYSLLNLMPESAQSAQLMMEMVEKRELSSNGAVAVAPDLEAARKMTAAFAEKPSIHRAMSAASFLPVNQESRIARLQSMVQTLRATQQAAAEGPALTPPGSVSAELEALISNLERLQDLAFRRGDGVTVAHLEDGIEAVQNIVDAIERDPVKTRARIDAFTATMRLALEDGLNRLETTANHGPITAADLPEAVRERFVSKDGRYAVYAFPLESVWDRPALTRFIKEAREVAPDLTGFAETYYENTEVIREGFLQAALYSGIAVLLFLFADLRRIRDTLLASFPLACGALWMLASMHLIGVSYNLANIVALPLIIGVGIDNAVHLLHRHRQNGDIAETFLRTGGAVVLSSATTMIGFGALSFASHRGMRSLGEVLFIGVGACLTAAILALPAGLSIGTPRREPSDSGR